MYIMFSCVTVYFLFLDDKTFPNKAEEITVILISRKCRVKRWQSECLQVEVYF